MWGLWENPDVMDSLIKKYQGLNPNVTINYDDRSVVKPGQYKDTVMGRLSQGNAPDIVLVHNSWVSSIKDNLSAMPSGLATHDSYSQTFYPVSSSDAVIDGNVYAVPMYYDGLALVYNKAHFDEIDQTTPPTAWEEFRRVALALTIKGTDGSLVRAGAALGTADNIDFFSDIIGLMFAQAGIEAPKDLDTQAARDAVSFYTMFSKTDGVWNASMPEASNAFAQGKVSMIFVPSWNLQDIIQASSGIDIGVAPVPQAKPEEPVSWASYWMYAVPKSSANAQAAWKFIDFLSQDEQRTQLFNDSSKIRPFGAPVASVSLKPLVESSSASKYIKPILDMAPYAKSSYFAGRSGNTSQVESLRKAVSSVLSARDAAAVEDAMRLLKSELSKVSASTE